MGRTTSYARRESSFIPAIGMALLALPVLALLTLDEDPDARSGRIVVGVAFALVVGLRVALARMDITVDDGKVTARYVPVGPTRSIPLDAIVSAEATRIPWIFGYGGFLRVHTRGAWGFFVFGTSAVEFRYTEPDGTEKAFFFGTNDPEGLLAAIRAARR